MTVRVEVLGDDGEWREVEGIASVEVHSEDPAPPPPPALQADDVAQFVVIFARKMGKVAEFERLSALFAQELKGTAEAAARAYATAVRRTTSDRPAWQSTYGPAQRRR